MNTWIKGMDLSSLMEVEACGGSFFDHGEKDDPVKILKRYGTNMVRLRLWNDPYDSQGNPYGAGTNDLARTMEMVRRVKAEGMDWMLDLHYSDFWADPGKQIMPKAWQGMDEVQVAEAVYRYTVSVLERLKEEDLLPGIVAVGNEITNGLLWPYGKYPNFENIVRFLNAGIRAVREAAPEAAVMLHLDNGGKNALYRDWFDRYFAQGGRDFDFIGLSFYPFWHGTMDQLRENMKDVAERYHKDLIVVETAMGFTLEDYAVYEGLAPDRRKGMAATAALSEAVDYPMTPQGQCRFMEDLMNTIREIPEDRGKGFVYWEPAWIPVSGSQWANPAALDYTGEKGPGGNEWANQALFDYAGNALPALEVIRDFDPIGDTR